MPRRPPRTHSPHTHMPPAPGLKRVCIRRVVPIKIYSQFVFSTNKFVHRKCKNATVQTYPCVSITFTLQAQVQSRLTPGTHTETCCARQPPRPQVTGREAGTACRSVRCGSRVWGKLRRHQCKSRQHCPPQARQPPRLQVNDQPKGRDRVPVCVQCGSREPQPALPDVHVRGQAARRVWGGGLGR